MGYNRLLSNIEDYNQSVNAWSASHRALAYGNHSADEGFAELRGQSTDCSHMTNHRQRRTSLNFVVVVRLPTCLPI